MSMSKQNERVGAKYVERQETVRKLARIQDALTEMRDKLRNAANAIDQRRESNPLVDSDLPTSMQVV